MTPLQDLHSAIGVLAYAMALSDGVIQKEEREKFHSIVVAEFRCNDNDFDASAIIFQILDQDKYINTQIAYDWAMKEIRLNSHYLSPKLKETFIKVMEKVANAYPPVTSEEMELLDRFRKDIAPINGDPKFYETVHQKITIK